MLFIGDLPSVNSSIAVCSVVNKVNSDTVFIYVYSFVHHLLKNVVLWKLCFIRELISLVFPLLSPDTVLFSLQLLDKSGHVSPSSNSTAGKRKLDGEEKHLHMCLLTQAWSEREGSSDII